MRKNTCLDLKVVDLEDIWQFCFIITITIIYEYWSIKDINVVYEEDVTDKPKLFILVYHVLRTWIDLRHLNIRI